MKKVTTMFLFLVAFTCSLLAQNVGDYRSAATGNWSDAAAWETWDGSAWVAAGAGAPADSVSTAAIEIQAGHTITVDAVIYPKLCNVTVNGTVFDNGGVDGLSGGIVSITGVSNLWVINSGGVYDMAHDGGATITYLRGGATAATSCGVPRGTWNLGSKCIMSGIASASPQNSAQNYDILEINSPNVGANFNLGMVTPGNTTTLGEVIVKCTGAAGRIYFGGMAAGTSGLLRNLGTVTVLRDLTVDGTATVAGVSVVAFSANGSSSLNCDYVINIMGNIVVTGNPTDNTLTNFSVSRGTLGSGTGAGTCVWNLYGDFTMSNATTANSDTTFGQATTYGQQITNVANARWVFKKAGNQYISLTNCAVTGRNNMDIEVQTGSNLVLNSPIQAFQLWLNGGTVTTTATNILSLMYNTMSGTTPQYSKFTVVGGSATSYIEGPVLLRSQTVLARNLVAPIAKGGVYRPLTLKVTLAGITASSQFTVEQFNTAPAANTLPGTLCHVSLNRHYTISENAGGLAFTNGSVKLTYGADDYVTDGSNLRIAQNDGAGNWVDIGGTGTGAPTGTITSTVAITSLAGTVFSLADVSCDPLVNPLPVELTSFTAEAKDGVVNLAWATATEVNNAGFVVLRDGVKIGFVKGSGTSSTPKSYSLVDAAAPAGEVAYTLQQVDNDGTATVVGNASVTVDAPSAYALKQNYPNPFNPSTVISYELPMSGFVTLKVYDVLGKEIATLVNQTQNAGRYTMNFSTSNYGMSSGIYFYRLESGSFTQMKKMVVLK